MTRDTKPNQMYRRLPNGNLVETGDDDPPEVVICRRVIDYQDGPPPEATIGSCLRCDQPIAFNPAKYADIPHLCMQCCGIEPA